MLFMFNKEVIMSNFFFISITVLLTLMIPEITMAKTGNETSGGGGDFLQRIFLKTAKKSISDLNGNQIRFSAQRQIPLEFLFDVIYENKLIVKTTDQPLILNGSQKSAITEGQTITLYRPDWENKATIELRSMVLHELMRVADVEDNDYAASEGLESALEGIDNFDSANLPYLKKITPRNNEFVWCEDNVMVTCNPIVKTAYANPIAVIKKEGQRYYFGKCFDSVVVCRN